MGRRGTAIITLCAGAVTLAWGASAGAQQVSPGLELDGPTAAVRTPEFSAGEGVFTFTVTAPGAVRLRARGVPRAAGCPARPPASTPIDRIVPSSPIALRVGAEFRGARGPQTLCAWLVPATGPSVVLARATHDVDLLEDPVQATVAVAPGTRPALGAPLRLVGTVSSAFGVPEGFCRFGQRLEGRWVDGVRFPFRGGVCEGVITARSAGVQRLRLRYTSFAAGDWASTTVLSEPVDVAGSGRIAVGRAAAVRARLDLVRPAPLVRGRAVRLEARLTSPAGPPAGVCRFEHRAGDEWVAGPEKPFRGGLCRGAVVPEALGLQRFRVEYLPADPDRWRSTRAEGPTVRVLEQPPRRARAARD